MQAAAQLSTVLDTVPLRGTLDISVITSAATRVLLGAALPGARNAVTCRMAALWTSRGDSLAVHWMAGDDLAVTSTRKPNSIADPADQPYFFEPDQPATFSLPDIMRTNILAAAHSAGAQSARPTGLVVLVDTTGRALIARLSSSSGVRLLDEAALRIYGSTQYHPAEHEGRPVRSWLRAEVHWPLRSPRPDSLLLTTE
jgi:hypothetical protein